VTPEVERQVRESRRRQGKPDCIEDPAFLSQLAEALLQVEGVAPDAA